MAVSWRKDMEIGIGLIDLQHQELFKRVDSLFEACNEGKGRKEILTVMAFLEGYVVDHFSAEEKLQRDSNYPEYQIHKEQHQEFMNNFMDLKKRIEEEGPTTNLVIYANRILVEWLVFHISKSDKAIASFISRK